MARMRSVLRTIDRAAYLVSRTAGDLNAAMRGPVPLVKRLARRDLTRTLFKVLREVAK